MTLLRAQLRHVVAEQVQALCPTIAVVENRAITTYTAQLPVVIFTAPMEHKESWGPGAPKFNTAVSLAADIKVSGSTEDVLERWEALAEMVELAVLGNAVVTRLVQEFPAVQSQVTVDDSGGTPVASGRIVFQIVLPQVYDPAMPDRLLEIDIFRDAAMAAGLADPHRSAERALWLAREGAGIGLVVDRPRTREMGAARASE